MGTRLNPQEYEVVFKISRSSVSSIFAMENSKYVIICNMGARPNANLFQHHNTNIIIIVINFFGGYSGTVLGYRGLTVFGIFVIFRVSALHHS